ncbi:hypothetical protein [Bacteroides sp. Phil13]|uniref:hypothetical protein n=1 Tax=Bacteroides sp. Phil13 TaxID=1929999 RepID=UPI00257A2F49|nr:hypothetical protein [Bacteroides sp. Phil13]
MPRIEFVEKTIFKKEGIDIKFFKDGKDVRGDANVPNNYQSINRTHNDKNVRFFIEKLKKQYPGYDFTVYDGDGNKVHGNVLLSKVRDSYEMDED